MRMKEEIACKIDEERREDETVSFHQQQKKLVVVGYALTSKKTKSFLQPKLEGLARNKGISFVAIDPHRSLSEQGPFDIVLHKLTGKEWRQILESACSFLHHDFDLIVEFKDYRGTHPEVTVLDPPDAIQHLHNRQSMLQCVADMNLSNAYGKVGVPRQLVIEKDASSIPEVVNDAGLTLPLVAKPLVADGSAKSHELSLAYDQYSLKKLEPPLVLQEFVNHGGVLFKVYIVGEAVKVVRRFSLPDVTKQELSKSAGVFRFPRVSCAAASADDADLDPSVGELPPRPLLERLAKELRRRLGLRLFNLDIIREHGTRDHFYVIDINYFPGKCKEPVQEKALLEIVEGFYDVQRVVVSISISKMVGQASAGTLYSIIILLATGEVGMRESRTSKTPGFCNYWPGEMSLTKESLEFTTCAEINLASFFCSILPLTSALTMT
ncbi:hypothetical protein JRO89_XS07G0097400 [Xanthoceras sorbifolium]|uniref:ATP-grasp domain-containing protein n=1 Tax=Xanthoceras sorbifolium TaxID=99658 RepID=A0ABQ8HTB9_9ROSI|nr:hypothetical protein JRO89_XS07G0097400 [Xanthoceras sorbifolium]